MPDFSNVTAQILDGKALAVRIKADLADRVTELRARGIVPGLGTVLVGDDPGSRSYVAGKHRDCAQVGIASLQRELPASASQDDVIALIDDLNADPTCTGYIVQLPLPRGLDEHAALVRIDPTKDADGLHPVNLGWLVLGHSAPLPCTARGTVELLRAYDIQIAGADVVIIGRGVTAGRPMGLIFSRRSENATVTICHTRTENLAAHVSRADILITAAGVPGLVNADMIKPGAVVVDVAITRTEQGLVGDTDPGVRQVAGWLAPVPGGIGPMTRAMLLTNVVEAAERSAGIAS